MSVTQVFPPVILDANNYLVVGSIHMQYVVTMPRLKAMTTGKTPSFIDLINNFNSKALNEDSLIQRFHEGGFVGRPFFAFNEVRNCMLMESTFFSGVPLSAVRG